MTKFIENVNIYITQMKIKQTYISIKSGINASTLSRILNNTREITFSEMEKISCALGKNIQFFIDEDFFVPQIPDFIQNDVSFYVGEPNEKQESFAMQLVDLLQNTDEVLSAKGRFLKIIEE